MSEHNSAIVMDTFPQEELELHPKKRRGWIVALIIVSLLVSCGCAVAVYVWNSLYVHVELLGDADVTVEYGGTYTDLGATAALDSRAFSDIHEDLDVTVEGIVDPATLGDYTLTYTASWRKLSAQAVRHVHVKDTVAPILTLEGDASITIDAGTEFVEPGFTASDNVDGDITQSVTVSGNVDTHTVGDYTLTYDVADSSGNTANATRTVKVQPIKQKSQVNPGHKVVYLTFDDGPSQYTAHLLDILKARNVRATFFVTGRGDASLIGRAAREGHTVAIHTYSHNYSKIYASKDAYIADMNKINDLIQAQTGKRSNLFRFPGGSSNTVSRFNPGIMTTLTRDLPALGYYYFDWNVSSGDAGGVTTSDAVYENVINGIKNHDVSVVLQHDVKGFSVDAVDRIITWGLSNGYTFLPLTETSPQAHQPVAN